MEQWGLLIRWWAMHIFLDDDDDFKFTIILMSEKNDSREGELNL